MGRSSQDGAMMGTKEDRHAPGSVVVVVAAVAAGITTGVSVTGEYQTLGIESSVILYCSTIMRVQKHPGQRKTQ